MPRFRCAVLMAHFMEYRHSTTAPLYSGGREALFCYVITIASHAINSTEIGLNIK